MGIFSIYTAFCLLFIFLSVFLISFFLIKVAEKKFVKQRAVIDLLSDEFSKHLSGFLITKDDMIIKEKNFLSDSRFEDYRIINSDKTKIIDFDAFFSKSKFITKKINIKDSIYYLIYFS